MYAKSSDPMQRGAFSRDMLFADDVDRGAGRPFGLLRRVDGRWITPLITDLGLCSLRRGNARCNPIHRFLGPARVVSWNVRTVPRRRARSGMTFHVSPA